MLVKIISGGQTGADQGALEGAHRLGFPTGGVLPRGCLTETGPRPSLLHKYAMVECGLPGYSERTKLNVQQSDGTVWFGRTDTPGYAATCTAVLFLEKPFRTFSELQSVDMSSKRLRDWIVAHNIEVLNVAGNRETKNPGLQQYVSDVIYNLLSRYTIARVV